MKAIVIMLLEASLNSVPLFWANYADLPVDLAMPAVQPVSENVARVLGLMAQRPEGSSRGLSFIPILAGYYIP